MKPQEADAVLSDIWKTFRQSEAFDAVLLILNEAASAAENALLAPGTESHARAHAAGQMAMVKRIMTTISRAVDFDPLRAEYPTDDSNQESDDFDIPPDTDQRV